MALVLALTACARDEPPRPAVQAALVPGSSVAGRLPPRRPLPSRRRQSPSRWMKCAPQRPQQAQRLTTARTYLDQAQKIAEERHRLAVLACEVAAAGRSRRLRGDSR